MKPTAAEIIRVQQLLKKQKASPLNSLETRELARLSGAIPKPPPKTLNKSPRSELNLSEWAVF